MNYFTKEELDYITKELLDNPTRETLEKLNKIYNGSTESVEVLEKTSENTNAEPPLIAPISETPSEPVTQNANVAPTPMMSEVPNAVTIPNDTVSETPTFEVPKLEVPVFNAQNNNPVEFTGNLWDAPKLEVNNLMQTTDNFGTTPTNAPSTEVPVSGAPFFGPSTETVNNPIPVNNAPIQTPTMFGQLEQNYM